jgi:hypothetical protein
METNLEAIKNGDFGLDAASRCVSSLEMRLKRHLSGKNYFDVQNILVIAAGVLLTVLTTGEMRVCITNSDLRSPAFKVAKLNNFAERRQIPLEANGTVVSTEVT